MKTQTLLFTALLLTACGGAYEGPGADDTAREAVGAATHASSDVDYLIVDGEDTIPVGCGMILTYYDGDLDVTGSCTAYGSGTQQIWCSPSEPIVRHLDDAQSYVRLDLRDTPRCISAGGFKLRAVTAYHGNDKKLDVGNFDAPHGSASEDCLEQFARHVSAVKHEFYEKPDFGRAEGGGYLYSLRIETKERDWPSDRRIEACGITTSPN